jgi:cardiolipin synthase
MNGAPSGFGRFWLVAYLLVLVVISFRLIMQRRPAGTTTAWLLSLIVLPYVGIALYLLIGERALGRRRAGHALALKDSVRAWFDQASEPMGVARKAIQPNWRSLHDLAAGATGSAALGGNALNLLDDAEAILGKIVADIDAAQFLCLFEFYIWHPGGLADDVAAALMRAASRGVQCRVLLDDVGSADFFRSPWPSRFLAAGVEVRNALPGGFVRALFRRIDLRLHRKLIVVDRRIGYTGSLNLVDPRCFKLDMGVGCWVDAMVRIEGPVVDALAALFAWDWAMEAGTGFQMDGSPHFAQASESRECVIVQTVPSGPSFEAPAIVQLLLSAVYGARSELTLTTPYFVPDEPLVSALKAAAQRGVRVRLIVPEKVDSWLARWASRAFYAEMLEAGVEVLLFRAGLLHTKSVVVDRELALFGTLNLDIRSFMLNFEVTLIVYGSPFATGLADLQERYALQSTALCLAEWRQRPIAQRFLENLIHLASPLL